MDELDGLLSSFDVEDWQGPGEAGQSGETQAPVRSAAANRELTRVTFDSN
jgi:hypothetical protein